MKNILNHDAVALIIARIAVTIIPTPIDFNNPIMIMRFFRSRTETKKAKNILSAFFVSLMASDYHFCPLYSSETVSFFLPFARRAANTLRPLADAILSRKPCLFFLFLLEG